jgi:hypothetical protein
MRNVRHTSLLTRRALEYQITVRVSEMVLCFPLPLPILLRVYPSMDYSMSAMSLLEARSRLHTRM